MALLAAACGGSPSFPGSGGPARASQPAAFSHCMRSHGVPSFPDPTASGAFPKKTAGQLGVTMARLQAAQTACQHLLPNRGGGPTSAQVRHMAAQALRFSQCVRGHGVANFPDPGANGRIPATLGIDQGSPLFQAANRACRKYRPPYIPSNAAYDAWARATR